MENRPKTEKRLRMARVYQERAVRMRDLVTRERDQYLRAAMLKLAEEYDDRCKSLMDHIERTQAFAEPHSIQTGADSARSP